MWIWLLRSTEILYFTLAVFFFAGKDWELWLQHWTQIRRKDNAAAIFEAFFVGMFQVLRGTVGIFFYFAYNTNITYITYTTIYYSTNNTSIIYTTYNTYKNI